MNKVYLLLRNNQQSGPYSLEELLHLPLKPFDLVWVEGKSFGWSYPAEVDALKPYLSPEISAPAPSPAAGTSPPASVEASSKKIFVSLPEGRTRPAAAASPSSTPERLLLPEEPAATTPSPEPVAEVSQTRYSRTIEEVEEDYTSWVHRQQVKKKKRPAILPWAAGLMALSAAAYWGPGLLWGDKTPASPRIAVSPVNTPSTADGINDSPPGSEGETQTPSLPEEESTRPASVSPRPATPRELRSSKPEVTSTTTEEKEATSSASTPGTNSETASREASPTEELPGENGSAGTQKEKKKIGKTINGWIEKIRNKKETGEENARSGNGGERRSSKRGEESSENVASLTDQLRLVASEPSQNWMTGVVGIRLTLYNQSRQMVRSATVEVSYFNEDKQLLEKKTLLFTNIGASRTKTLAVPDHRMADHARYAVIAAVGDQEGYTAK